MEFFNYEGHRKLWLLLAENIYVATKENYNGNGYYNAYSALEKLKKELLCLHFPAEERNPRNYCFACQAAKIYQEAIWINDEEIHCESCPLQWPEQLHCDENGSLYRKLIDCLEASNITDAAAICAEIADVKPFDEKEFEKMIFKEVNK